MTPVLRIGPYCSRCNHRPAMCGDLCSACHLLLKAFGHDPAEASDSLTVCESLWSIPTAKQL